MACLLTKPLAPRREQLAGTAAGGRGTPGRQQVRLLEVVAVVVVGGARGAVAAHAPGDWQPGVLRTLDRWSSRMVCGSSS